MKMLATLIFFLLLTGCASTKSTNSVNSESQVIKALTTYGCNVKTFDMSRVMGKLHVECK